MTRQPVQRQQRSQVVLVCHRREPLKDVLEVSERIRSSLPDIFDQSVEDRASLPGVFAADEHPVLRSELGGADRVFHCVVVEGDRAVIQEDLQFIPEPEGVAAGTPQGTFGQAMGKGSQLVLDRFDERKRVLLAFLSHFIGPGALIA